MKKNNRDDIKDAFALFPDLFRSEEKTSPQIEDEANRGVQDSSRSEVEKKDVAYDGPAPPPPPDVGWLRESQGDLEEQDHAEDLPTALLLSKENGVTDQLASSFKQLGYHLETAGSPNEAIARLASFQYAVVVVHASFEPAVSISNFKVHRHILWLPMEKRRLMYYILVGPEFHSLYNLEALTFSANLVINDASLNHLDAILQKSLREYEELFAPLLEAMAIRR